MRLNICLTAPYTPQTNGMVEINGTIKNTAIKVKDYENIYDIKKDLNKFLIYYNSNRIDRSLRKGLKVRIPFQGKFASQKVSVKVGFKRSLKYLRFY